MSGQDTMTDAERWERQAKASEAALELLNQACDITREACQLLGERMALEDQDLCQPGRAVTQAVQAQRAVDRAFGECDDLARGDRKNADNPY